jgi:hypothetical protein
MKSRRMRWAEHVARMDWKRDAYRLLVGKLEGKRPLGRPRRKWMANIRMDLVEVGWSDVDWIGLTQHRDRWRALVNFVFNLQVRVERCAPGGKHIFETLCFSFCTFY